MATPQLQHVEQPWPDVRIFLNADLGCKWLSKSNALFIGNDYFDSSQLIKTRLKEGVSGYSRTSFLGNVG